MRRVVGHLKRLWPLSHHMSEGAVEFTHVAYFDRNQRDVEPRKYHPEFVDLSRIRFVIWVPKKGHASELRDQLFEELETFGDDIRSQNCTTRNVPKLAASPAWTGNQYTIGTMWTVYLSR